MFAAQLQLNHLPYFRDGGSVTANYNENTVILGPWAESYAAYSGKQQDRTKAAIDLLNRIIGEPQSDNNMFALNTLRRHTYYFALSLWVKDKTSKKPERRAPKWEKLSERYSKFYGQLADQNLITSISPSMVRDFATHAVDRPRDHRFVPSLAIFLRNEIETYDGFQVSLNKCAPVEELKFLEKLEIKFFKPLFDNAKLEQIEANLATKKYAKASMGFAFEKLHQTHFLNFYNAFKSNKNKHAHFTVYRHAKSDPQNLVKSFLGIGPPVGGRDYHRFFHFYRVPSIGDKKMVSKGFVVPLASGVYLIGGQSIDTEAESSYAPFESLELIALDWSELRAPEPIFSALAISANYKGEKLLSPMAMRATPIYRHQCLGAKIDQFYLNDLQRNLENDITKEEELKLEPFLRIPVEQQRKQIIRFTNPAKMEWEVPGKYVNQTDEADILSKVKINAILEDKFGTSSNPKYFHDNEEPFGFWQSLRFGPISKK
jgi:hypothetical protein